MIIVRVELWSAITGVRTELARIKIANDGEQSARNRNSATYVAESFIGRDTAALDRETVSKTARVPNWPRKQLHIWNLVHRVLGDMGYTQGPKAIRVEEERGLER